MTLAPRLHRVEWKDRVEGRALSRPYPPFNLDDTAVVPPRTPPDLDCPLIFQLPSIFSAVNWEAINATAQLISSISVVVSLWYLAVQVHRGTRVAKLAATTALRDVTRPFAENAEVGRLWRIGLEDLDSLDAEEKARFYHVAFQFLKAMETIHHHYVYGLMEEQVWHGWCNLYRHYLATPGLEYYWQLRHDLFSDRFQQFVAGLERPAERRTVGNLLGEEQSSEARSR